jgi:Flp pilus assembly protein TadD
MNVHRPPRPLLALTAFFVLVGSASHVAAQSAPGTRILVMPFAAEVEPDAPGGAGTALWLGEAAAVLIAEGLTSLGLGAIDRDDRVAAFDTLQLPMKAVLTRATIIRVAELIGATDVVFGEVHLGDALAVRARMIHVDAGRQATEVTDRADLDDLFEAFERVAAGLARQGGFRATGTGSLGDRLPLEVFENYMKGLVASTPAAQRRFLEAAMTAAPHDGRILTALWSVYNAEGEHEQALAAASAVAADSPHWRRARFAVALSLIELGRFDGALRELAALEAERPRAAVANARGLVELRRGQPDSARAAAQHFQQAAERAPGHTAYLFNAGYAHARSGDAAAALHWLRETVRFDAANGDAHLVMSAVLSSIGRTIEARRELDLARLLGTGLETAEPALSPAVPAGLEQVTLSLDATIPTDVQAAIANPAQRDQQEAAAYHLERGRRLVEEQRDREAVDELRRAIYLAPYADHPHLLLGRVYERMGRLPDAVDEYTVALWCRETLEGRVALGSALLDSGDRAGAEREAKRALELDPESAAARALLARVASTAPSR